MKTKAFLLVCLIAAMISGLAYTVIELDKAKAASATTLEYAKAMQKEFEPYCRERITQLPEDGHAWYVTVYVDANYQGNPKQRELVTWFYAVPELKSLATQTHFAVITPKSSTYARYRASIGDNRPCVTVQLPDGKVIYKATGPKIPDNSWRLVDDIREAIAERFPNLRPCPGPGPCPTPTPTPTPSPVPTPGPPSVVPAVPDLGPPSSTTPAGDDSLVVAGVAGVLAFAIGIAAAWRRSNF